MLQVFKTTKKMPKQLLDVPAPPAELMYLVDYYNEVRDADGLTFQNIDCWSRVMKTPVEAWEVKTLFAIDRLFWSIKGGVKRDGN